MKRFHKNVFMPKLNINKFWRKIRKIWYTHHFFVRVGEREHKCRGWFIVPTIQNLKQGEIFEIYVSKNCGNYIIEKVCVRLSGKYSDFCYVIGKDGGVITAWATGKYNQYDKIDYSIYATSL